jgi:hypothetical protein
MRRVLLKALAVLSLVLLAATVVVWLRSYWRQDTAATSGLTKWTAESRLGSLRITRSHDVFRTLRYWDVQPVAPSWNAIREGGFWFHYEAGEQDQNRAFFTDPPTGPPVMFSVWYRFQMLTIPYWAPALFFAAAPAWWFFYVRRRRTPAGHCPTCRYDLRAHAPGQKCPECGTVIPTARTAGRL